MLIQHVMTQGMDPIQVAAFLDQIGICEENPYWLGFMQQPGYINAMKNI